MEEYYYEQLLAGMISILLVISVIVIIFSVIMIVATWKIFSKAGEEGWKSLIPFYNSYILFKITWGNGIYFLFLFIPFVNIAVGILTYYKLANAFGHGLAFTIGLLLFPWIFISILGFGSDMYVGNSSKDNNTSRGELENV